jgi:hypothetical protein
MWHVDAITHTILVHVTSFPYFLAVLLLLLLQLILLLRLLTLLSLPFLLWLMPLVLLLLMVLRMLVAMVMAVFAVSESIDCCLIIDAFNVDVQHAILSAISLQ